jgi:putative oxidoreductase
MKILNKVSRFLLGLIFLIFGLNGFLHFIPMPPPSGVAGQFFGALFVSNYLVPIFGLQVISGALLLVNRFVPLALTILAAIIVNILELPKTAPRTSESFRTSYFWTTARMLQPNLRICR